MQSVTISISDELAHKMDAFGPADWDEHVGRAISYAVNLEGALIKIDDELERAAVRYARQGDEIFNRVYPTAKTAGAKWVMSKTTHLDQVNAVLELSQYTAVELEELLEAADLSEQDWCRLIDHHDHFHAGAVNGFAIGVQDQWSLIQDAGRRRTERVLNS